jgi:hypothetical protein
MPGDEVMFVIIMNGNLDWQSNCCVAAYKSTDFCTAYNKRQVESRDHAGEVCCERFIPIKENVSYVIAEENGNTDLGGIYACCSGRG